MATIEQQPTGREFTERPAQSLQPLAAETSIPAPEETTEVKRSDHFKVAGAIVLLGVGVEIAVANGWLPHGIV